MRIGFTGTQRGMTAMQLLKFRLALIKWQPEEFRHGDCVSADAQAHEAVREIFPEAKIVVHPPLDPRKRAFCVGDEEVPAEEYLARNRRIVRSSDVLIATPGTVIEKLRSGTWSTVRFARKLDVKVVLIEP